MGPARGLYYPRADGSGRGSNNGSGDDGTASAARRTGQGTGRIPRGYCRGGRAGERRRRQDEGAERPARRTVAADAQRRRDVSDLHWLTTAQAARAIAARELSPVELMTALLERIDRLDPKLHVFIRLDRDAA